MEISTLMMKAPNRTSNPCNHYTMTLLVINPCAHQLTSPKMFIPASAIENTSKNREEAIEIVNE
jgi:hypothetical protein